MDTVVEEKPLSFATSRMVTIKKQVSKFQSFRVVCGAIRQLEPNPFFIAAARLNFERALADTTAESDVTVKRRKHAANFHHHDSVGCGDEFARSAAGFWSGWESGFERSGTDLPAGTGCAGARKSRRRGAGFSASAGDRFASGRGIRQFGCGLHAAQAVGQGARRVEGGREVDAAGGGGAAQYRAGVLPAE